MTTITSESPNGKKRIVIDPSNETVTFIGCFPAPATSFFSIPRPHPEFVCRFENILNVYKMPQVGSDFAKRLPKCYQIVTASGSASFSANWSNFDEAINALREISASTPDVPAIRNPHIGLVLFAIGCFMAAAIFIGLYFWLMGG